MFAGERFVRRRSVKNVIQEVKDVQQKYRFEIARFEDDTFNADKKWVREFSDEFRKLNVKLICTGINASLVDEELVRSLKEANCIAASFGIEAGSEKVRKEILERMITDEQLVRCAQLFRKYGIFYATENILAIPTTTLEDDLKTLGLNIQCRSRYPLASLMQPYPGTKIYELALKNKWLEGNAIEDLPESLYDKTIFSIDHKYERENLQKLFAITVKFPFLFRHIRWLITLRMGPFYSWLYKVYKGYIGAFKYIPGKRSFRENLGLIRRYFSS
jgi:radical SAM superfamily enzyme YgiQ (UPF0313 family)